MIDVRVIDHAQQRYATVGDWRWAPASYGDELVVRVSRCGDWRYEVLIAVHEIIEAFWCRGNNVRTRQVDDFDELWEAETTAGRHPPEAEPGDDLRCPYYTGHQIASIVERTLAVALGVKWGTYEAATTALWNTTR